MMSLLKHFNVICVSGRVTVAVEAGHWGLLWHRNSSKLVLHLQARPPVSELVCSI